MRCVRRFASSAGFGRAVLDLNLRRPPSPLKVNLALTYRCQYRCQTCDIWQVKPTGELTTDEVLTFVARNDFLRWADLTGGEIFLRQDVDEILRAIGRTWKKLAILHYPTNGFLTERIVEATRRLSTSTAARVVVTVSLDGPEKLNDAVRGVEGGYRRQVETLRKLREIPGVKAVAGMTLSALNLGAVAATLAALAEDCPGFSPDDLHLNVMQISPHYYGNEERGGLVPPTEEVAEVLSRHRNTRRRRRTVEGWLEERFLALLKNFLRTGRTPLPCAALKASCFIDPWGRVYPCIAYDKVIGSLRENAMDLLSVWRRAETLKLQAEIEGGECPHCWTACEAYQTILGNTLRRPGAVLRGGRG